jgi:hypothetical protein
MYTYTRLLRNFGTSPESRCKIPITDHYEPVTCLILRQMHLEQTDYVGTYVVHILSGGIFIISCQQMIASTSYLLPMKETVCPLVGRYHSYFAIRNLLEVIPFTYTLVLPP